MLVALVKRGYTPWGCAYVPWLLMYVISGLMLWHGKGGEDLDRYSSSWLAGVPLGVIGLQCMLPTLLGWISILLFALSYNGLLAYIVYFAHSVHDPGEITSIGDILITIFAVGWWASSIALIFAARPKSPISSALQ